ncbi:nuclear pore complex protein Nup133-like isoform X2 [Oculina patagonica]
MSFEEPGARKIQQRALLTSHLLEETDKHCVETFGLPLPVQISENLTNQEAKQHTSVKINHSGWAWLVTGRKLFVWRFISAVGTKGLLCKELMLPASELYHMADLVCVVSPCNDDGSNMSGVSVMAVSPEGVVRYWPSLTHGSSSIDLDTDLIGSQCHSLTAFQPFGCILMTTTNELLLLSGSQKAIKCHNLNAPSSVFTELGRRMTSFIFGSQPAANHEATNWQRVLASNIMTDNSRELFVLSDNQLFTWKVFQTGPGNIQEKLVFQLRLDNLFKEAAINTRQVEAQSADDIMVWCLDMAQLSSRMLVLAAVALRGSQTTHLFYFLGVLNTDATHVPTSLESSTILPYSVTYDESNEQQLLDFKLLLLQQSSSAFVYNTNSVICVSVSRVDEALNKVDLQYPSDSILGSGSYEDKPLFFSLKHGIITITLTGGVISEEMDTSRLQSSEVKTVDIPLTDTTIGEDSDDLQKIKSAFLLFCQGNTDEALQVCEISESAELDNVVLALSQEVIDDFPVSDPRWAESIPAGGISSSTSLIILHQLQDKLKAHSFMVEFLKSVGLWGKLGIVTSKERPSLTCHLICEHAEKLSAAIALCKINKTYQEVVDESIKLVMKKRQLTSQARGLTEQDLFFREVSVIADIFECLLSYEEYVFRKQKSSVTHLQTVLAVNTIVQEMLQEAWHYRQTNFTVYQPSDTSIEFNTELVPWTATTGPSGVRSLLLKQIALSAERGVTETADQQTSSLLVQQMVDLADILLDGYVHQLQTLRTCPGMKSHYDEVSKQYEQDRRTVILPLVHVGQRSHAASLAEKYHDFGVLIELCESTGDQSTLQQYMTQFTEEGFSDYLFKWYMDKGERQKLMTIPEPQHEDLASFLSSHHHLRWLHDIHLKSFYQAYETLKGLAIKEATYLAKKKTLLSLSKLSLLASDENNGPQLEEIINEHDILLHQETLPSKVLQKAGLDLDSMLPLPPTELIELHIGDQNPEANEYDFKKALDILHLALLTGLYDMDQAAAVKLHIWCKALLRDDWSSLPAKDPLLSAKNTVFFKTVELAYTQGVDLAEFIPSLESLFEAEELGNAGLSENPQFRFLLKSGYEQIARAAILSS